MIYAALKSLSTSPFSYYVPMENFVCIEGADGNNKIKVRSLFI